MIGVPTIAPLWADFDFSDVGTIYYRVVTESKDPATLEEAKNMVTNFNEDLSDYRPTLAVIVTWFEAERYEDSSGIVVRK